MCPCGHDHLLHPDVLPDGKVVAGPGRCIEQVDFAPPGLLLFTLAKCDCAGCRCAACSPRRGVVMVEDDGSVRALLDFVSGGQRAQAAADRIAAESGTYPHVHVCSAKCNEPGEHAGPGPLK